MKKKYLSLLMAVLVIAVPMYAMQSIQRDRTKESCWTKVKYVATLCYSKYLKAGQQEAISEDERSKLFTRYVGQIKELMTENDFRLRPRRVEINTEMMAENPMPAFA